MAVKTPVIKMPINTNSAPILSGLNNKIGMPAPIKKESANEDKRPKKILRHILFLFNGWLSSNSINSELLYMYMVLNIMDTSGVVRRMMFNKVKTPFVLLSSKLKTVQLNAASRSVYNRTILFFRISSITYLSILNMRWIFE